MRRFKPQQGIFSLLINKPIEPFSFFNMDSMLVHGTHQQGGREM